MTTAFIFPGQGSQSVGMGADWLGRSALVRQTFEEADTALGEALSKVILEGPMEDLTRTENTQPALLTVSVAYWRVLEAEGLLTPSGPMNQTTVMRHVWRPGDVVRKSHSYWAGHSLSE